MNIGTVNGAWRGETVAATVGREVQFRQGYGGKYAITRVSVERGQVAIKPIGFAGFESWADPEHLLAL